MSEKGEHPNRATGDTSSGDVHPSIQFDPMANGDEVTLMIVDAEPGNQIVLGDLFRKNGFDVRVARNGDGAIGMAKQEPRPSLILLDITMPGTDGIKTFGQLRCTSDTHDIPVIFLTRGDDAEIDDAVLGGVNVDFIERPFKPRVVMARVRNHLLVSKAQRLLRNRIQRNSTFEERREQESAFISKIRIRALAHIADSRDHETTRHVQRTQSYVRFIAQRLSLTEKYARDLTGEIVEAMVDSAALHDIGKAGIPDNILFKPGPLTAEERSIMEAHTLVGYDAISMAAECHVVSRVLLRQLEEIVRSHHECWDGSGYPDGLAGESIPLSARIMAVADVFDALVEKRVYKGALTFSEAREIIFFGRGKQFDPFVVDVLMSCWGEFEKIASSGC